MYGKTMSNVNKQWEQCLDLIKANLPEAEQYDAWFAPIRFVGFADHMLTLHVPSLYYVEILEGQYLSLLAQAIKTVFGAGTKMRYTYDAAPDTQVTLGDTGESVPVKVAQQAARFGNPFEQPKLEDIDPQLNPRYTFENYCSSTSNKLAVTVAQAIAEHPEVKTYNPMLIFGSTGVGKTHLIHAIGIRIKERNPHARVLYVTARVFERQYTTAVAQKKVNDFIGFYQSIDVLLLDDIQEFAGKTATQNTFFHIFNHLHQHQRQLVMTSDCRPVDMEGMVPRLLSRFKWGITVELDKPDYALRREVLIRRAEQDGLTLGDDVVNFIATNITESVREIEGVVVSLLAHATMLGSDITLDLARHVISNSVKTSIRELTFDEILRTIAVHCGIKAELIFAKTRKREVSDARQLVMYFARKLAEMPLVEIGNRLSRTHATVLHAVGQIEQRLSVDNDFADEVAAIEAKLLNAQAGI